MNIKYFYIVMYVFLLLMVTSLLLTDVSIPV